MRHRSVQSRAASLTAAAALAIGLGATAAQATFVLDLKLTGGGTSTTVTAGTPANISIDVWGTVTSAATGATGIQDAFFGVQNSGGVGTILPVSGSNPQVGVALASPFTGVATDVSGVTTSYGGTLYGTTYQSVGSATADSTVADGWVFARSTQMTPVTNGTPTKLGTLTFRYDGAASTGSTTLSLVARTASSLVVPAVWQEGGQAADGTPTLGSSVTISVQAAVVNHLNGNTPGPNGNYLNTSGDTTKESVGIDDFNAVIANFGSTNAAGYAWPRTPGNAGGPVGIADFNAVIANFGHTNDPSGVALAPALAAVPEPASLSVLGVVGGLALAGRRRR